MVSDSKNPPKAQKVVISKDVAGQRIDNFLLNFLKGVPRTRVYRIIRKGEVRLNQGRIKPDARLKEGDIVRIPPIRYSEKETDEQTINKAINKASYALLETILYEDDDLIILNKPSGWAVHGGSGVHLGVIETLRILMKKDSLELVHRLDRDTSGCLLIAKNKTALRDLHEKFRSSDVDKVYWALVKGNWQGGTLVSLPLQKNFLKSGERIVRVSKSGIRAETVFKTLKKNKETTLLEARLLTGRTHQIRVHTAAKGSPIVGDDKYGDAEFNRQMKKAGLARMCLHAKRISLTLPNTIQKVTIEAPLNEAWGL